jgi:hypothetical protein
MRFEPDILVEDPREGGAVLIVEAKLRLADLDAAERSLKEYMSGVRCPTGMIVSPDRILVYRDQFRDRTPASVTRVDDVSVPGLFAADQSAIAFENEVQAWIERLTRGHGLDDLPAEAKISLEEHILPSITQGDVRAMGPRAARL